MKYWLYRKKFNYGSFIASEYQEIPETDLEALEMWTEYDGGKMIPRRKVTAEYWRDLIDGIRVADGWKRAKPTSFRIYGAPLCVADPAKLKQRSDDNTVQRFPPGLVKYLHFAY